MKRNEVVELLKELNQTFDTQMQPLLERKLLTKKRVEDMKAGCSDGARICISMLQEKGLLKIED